MLEASKLRYIVDTAAAARAALTLATEPILGIDIETTGLDPRHSEIRLLQAAALDGRVTIFDLRHVALTALAPLCQTKWVTFNGAFEYQHLTHAGLHLPPLHDLMLLDRLNSYRTRKLSEVVQQHLDVDLDKAMQTSDWAAPELSREQIEYAALDAITTVRAAAQLLPQIDRNGQRRLYDLWCQCIPVLSGLTLRGQSFDWDAHSRLMTHWSAEKEKLQSDLRDQLGSGVNPGSGPQLGEWLTKQLPPAVLKHWPRTATGRVQTSADVLALHADLPVIQPLLRYKAVNKLLTTYGASWQKQRHPDTNRLHSDFRIGSTRSGRICCSGPNTQNPPRLEVFRKLFIPPSGHILIGADYSQIELRVAALLSGDHNMIDVYRTGQDLHTKTAAAVAGVPLDQVTQAQRTAAKAVNFGNLYGQGPAGLARKAKLDYGTDVSLSEAKQALRRFAMTYPLLEHWKKQQVAYAMQYRQVKTRLGLVRDFDVQGEGYLRGEAQNIPVQGSAAEVLMSALARLPEALANTGAELYHTVHDEIELTCNPEEQGHVAAILQESMVAGFLDVFPEGEALTRDLVQVHSGSNWAEVH